MENKISWKLSLRGEFLFLSTLSRYLKNKDRMVIVRRTGGLGDILMQRMIFEDAKRVFGGEVHFACPPKYFDAVIDHPFLDAVLDCRTVDFSQYGVWYDITSVCNRYETRLAPLGGKNRSDIWANHCGLKLVNHRMHIQISDEERERARELLNPFDGIIVAFSPISAMIVKNFLPQHISAIKEVAFRRNVRLVGLHHVVPDQWDSEIPLLSGLSIREWMAVIEAADGVLSVDTSAFHLAGGLGKPTVGMFTFADGKIYGKYYDTAETVQLHRDTDSNWCGPCYLWSGCTKCKTTPKPCLTELPVTRITSAFERLIDQLEKVHA